MKFRILYINTCDYGSTGNMARQLCELVEQDGGEALFSVPRGRHNRLAFNARSPMIGNQLSEDSHILLGKLTGLQGCFSVISTAVFLNKIKKLQIDMIHLHNLHNSYINLPLLFRFIKKNQIPVVWTLHDCWSFTGHCPHFTLNKCDKWKNGCHHCELYREYPKSYVDHSGFMYKLKKKWFCGVENMTVVTPSAWLGTLVGQSFLSKYPVRVIHNGIDLRVFRPTESNFREKYGISEAKKILLGVAFGWGMRKGLDVFVSLAERLDPNKYQIVLVGTDDTVDRILPENIISIHRTQNQAGLVEIYSVADLFINASREENFPTVNMEALACGTPVLTFRTGGSPESIDETCGSVVEYGDISAMEKEIVRICTDNPYSSEACVRRAADFDKNLKFREYLELYKEM